MILKYDPPIPDGPGGKGEATPQERPFKHLILGIDGTWQAAYSDIFYSNVFRLNVALNYRDNSPNQNFQVFIYSSGLGTTNKSSRLAAGVLGDGLDESILQAYINLVSNYTPGDKIYIVGFSRGAVAARALSGFISFSGLLKADYSALIEHAWRYFTDKPALIDYPSQRKDATHEQVDIEFLGVWDTVSGPYKQQELMQRYRFTSLKLDPGVKYGVHILSIDETRDSFEPLLWSGTSRQDQVLEQIWMPGVHCDVGGGYNYAFLSTISLLLMIDKLAQYHPLLGFDESYITSVLLPIIEKEKIVVNDEWAGYKARMFKWFTTAVRYADSDSENRIVQHPLTGLMFGKQVDFKSSEMPYVPSFRFRKSQTLQQAAFENDSWYQRELAKRLLTRFS
jgi:hypothetical protein